MPLKTHLQPSKPTSINDNQVGRRDAVGVLVSSKEEADLEDLLGMFALGLGEPEEFAARLQVGEVVWRVFGIVCVVAE
jgi:hypothetical protein